MNLLNIRVNFLGDIYGTLFYTYETSISSVKRTTYSIIQTLSNGLILLNELKQLVTIIGENPYKNNVNKPCLIIDGLYYY